MHWIQQVIALYEFVNWIDAICFSIGTCFQMKGLNN